MIYNMQHMRVCVCARARAQVQDEVHTLPKGIRRLFLEKKINRA